MCLMIENAVLGKPYECKVREDQGLPLTYIKDNVRATEMLYYAPKEQIKTVCYNIIVVSQARISKELEITLQKVIPEAKITFNQEP